VPDGSVLTFLDRLDALQSSPRRQATRAADHAALALLERRGVATPAIRQRMRHLVGQLKSSLDDEHDGAAVTTAAAEAVQPALAAAHRANLVALKR
jgi:hypothetical protein